MGSMAPATINVSIGTAVVLGLARAPMAAAPTTAYLMLGGRCQMSCAFCAQARDSRASALTLSRVTWPEYPLDSVVERLAQAAADGTVRRTCLQVTVTSAAFDQALAVVQAVKTASAIPFDVAFLPHSIDQVRQIVEAGADHVGFGLDAACERVFNQVKGGNWAHGLALIEQAAQTFPGQVGLHLIVGLGETEQEMVERIQWAHDRGVTTGLFAFTPLRGTHLADRPPPPLAVYRRMQAARWLIAHGLARVEGMAFDPQGCLLDLGGPLPASGEPFQTSGCPDCNRPFYNEQPGGVLYNYPRPLTAEEATQAVQAMEMWEG
jgi:biotin synthase-related radical SAM superfamily protein